MNNVLCKVCVEDAKQMVSNVTTIMSLVSGKKLGSVEEIINQSSEIVFDNDEFVPHLIVTSNTSTYDIYLNPLEMC